MNSTRANPRMGVAAATVAGAPTGAWLAPGAAAAAAAAGEPPPAAAAPSANRGAGSAGQQDQLRHHHERRTRRARRGRRRGGGGVVRRKDQRLGQEAVDITSAVLAPSSSENQLRLPLRTITSQVSGLGFFFCRLMASASVSFGELGAE